MTGVQTCALPICFGSVSWTAKRGSARSVSRTFFALPPPGFTNTGIGLPVVPVELVTECAMGISVPRRSGYSLAGTRRAIVSSSVESSNGFCITGARTRSMNARASGDATSPVEKIIRSTIRGRSIINRS